jgi:hypothetical protein
VDVSRRRNRLHAEIGGFMKKYGKKKHPNRWDPNDRQIDHELERELKRLSPAEFDELLHGDPEADSDSTVGRVRELAPRERDALTRILEAASFAGASELRGQVPDTRVVVGDVPLFLDLEVESPTAAPASALPDGPIPTRALVQPPDREPIGELLVWVTAGYLSGLEFAWVTEDMPTGLPPVDHLQIQP